MEKAKVIVISGSMRFWNTILKVADKLTQEGNIVLSPFKDSRSVLTSEDLKLHAELHRQKIDMADEMYVVNLGGYIGDAVQDEIDYANQLGMEITYHEPLRSRPYIVTLCGSKKFEYEFVYQFEKLTKEGKIVLLPAIFRFPNSDHLSTRELALLDVIHQEKMKMSDEVLVINKDGYIGDDTQKEIDWCNAHNIKVSYIENAYKDDKFAL